MRRSTTVFGRFSVLISIHAPIVGCDKDLLKFFDDKINFNPRTHRGVRPSVKKDIDKFNDISIHAPIVGCDTGLHQAFTRFVISIHAPIVGCDVEPKGDVGKTLQISIHAPIVGCDYANINVWWYTTNFNPRTHRGVRLYLSFFIS